MLRPRLQFLGQDTLPSPRAASRPPPPPGRVQVSTVGGAPAVAFAGRPILQPKHDYEKNPKRSPTKKSHGLGIKQNYVIPHNPCFNDMFGSVFSNLLLVEKLLPSLQVRPERANSTVARVSPMVAPGVDYEW